MSLPTDRHATLADLTNMPRLFFSFHGRAGRAAFWLVALTWGVLGLAFDAIWSGTGAAQVPVGGNHFVDAAFAAPLLVMLVSCVAIAIKRLHDRNKRAWWLLPFYVAPPVLQAIAPLDPLESALMVALMVLSGILSLWALVELGCLRGTHGPNRYGPDPLLAPAPEPA
jgi:uncharacterized membrane protein YhaH (DUF805 family)